MLTTTRTRRTAAVVLAAGLTAVACQSEPDSPESEDTPDPTGEPSPPEDPPESPTESPTADDEAPTDGDDEPDDDAAILDEHGVAAAHPLAVQAGMDILDAGGNAVDAAVATSFAVSVVEPFASGMGGGGATLVGTADGSVATYDYRAVVANDGVIPENGAGIPGFVAGMGELHEDLGVLDWDEVLAPAAELAEDGFPVSDFLANRLASDAGPPATSGHEHFAPGGSPLQAGDLLVQEALAQTITILGDEGPDAFYTGQIADQLAEFDGLDADSLADYEVVHSEPVSGSVGDYEVIAAAPPLPGAALIQMLQTLENSGIDDVDPNSAAYVEAVSEAWLIAEETSMTQLGDPAFVDVPVDDIIDSPQNISLTGADTTTGYDHPESSPNTTHITVVDSEGTVISMTNTITNFWGSQQMAGGFFLNNQLTRFEAIDSPQNQPAPGRRSVSWTNPVIVLDDENRPVLGIGTPGGLQILNILGNGLTRWALLDQSLDDAVAAPRFLFDSAEQTLNTEDIMSTEVIQDLNSIGWNVEQLPTELATFGSIQGLEIDYESGEIFGPVDDRREADSTVEAAPDEE